MRGKGKCVKGIYIWFIIEKNGQLTLPTLNRSNSDFHLVEPLMVFDYDTGIDRDYSKALAETAQQIANELKLKLELVYFGEQGRKHVKFYNPE